VADWHYQFPSVTTFFKLIGDKTYAERFRGDALNLLYELKNLMTFRKLKQLIMFRRFTDGTTITAKSVFGCDFLTINVSRSIFAAAGIGIEESCTITMVYLNEYVQPMRYPGEIKEGEQEGIDYIKTYFTFNKSKCPSCADQVEWEFTFNYATEEQIDYYDSEPNNHCVISQDGGCSGEVIERGADEDGSYIIWKVYTEAENHNRSGLGYMRFRAVLKNQETKKVICEFSDIIGVDCCVKDGLGKPEIYWEMWQWVECVAGTMNIGGAGLCQVPDEIGLSKLLWYAAGGSGGAARFYALAEVGGCPPYEWSTTWGSVEVIDPLGRIVIWHPPSVEDIDCHTSALITVTARCGGEDFIYSPSACESASLEPVEIGYTTLSMQCDGAQALTAGGGIPPYIWSLVGGGSLVVSEDTLSATYTAPSSNAECASNPSILLSDCCGGVASISMAVNCDTGNNPAYSVYTWTN
jgi:hypothetical protein